MMELVFLKLQVMNDLLHSSFQQTSSVDLEKNQLSNEKHPGWSGYIGDYTTQVYRDHNKPL